MIRNESDLKWVLLIPEILVRHYRENRNPRNSNDQLNAGFRRHDEGLPSKSLNQGQRQACGYGEGENRVFFFAAAERALESLDYRLRGNDDAAPGSRRHARAGGHSRRPSQMKHPFLGTVPHNMMSNCTAKPARHSGESPWASTYGLFTTKCTKEQLDKTLPCCSRKVNA